MKFPGLNIEKKIGQQSKLIWVGTGVMVIGIGYVLANMGVSKEKRKSIESEKPATVMYRDKSVTGLEQTVSDIQLMQKRFIEMQEKNLAQERTNTELTAAIKDLKGKVSEMEARPPEATSTRESLSTRDSGTAPTFKVNPPTTQGPTTKLNAPLPRPLQPGGAEAPAVTPADSSQITDAIKGTTTPPSAAQETKGINWQPMREIRVADASGNKFNFQEHREKSREDFNKAFGEKKEPGVFMPAGSMFSAVLMTGVDMPASTATQQNPVPVVFRVKREAILPNYASIDVRDCFLLGSGFGQLSSERAILRAEALTCVTNKGKVLEAPFNAFIVGPDGKVGIHGRLVSKQGAMIARALIGGIFGGLAGNASPMGVPSLNLNPQARQMWQDPDFGVIAQSGVTTGIRSATSSISRFYLKMAEETFPVIEVSAGEGVTVVVSQGANLPLKGSTDLQAIDGGANGAGGQAGAPQQGIANKVIGALTGVNDSAAKPMGQGQPGPAWQSGQAFGTPKQPGNVPVIPNDVENIIKSAIGRAVVQ